MSAHGLELHDGPDGAEVCELNLARGVTLNGPTGAVIAWLREADLEALAVAVADAHFARMFHDAETPLLKQWLGRGGVTRPCASCGAVGPAWVVQHPTPLCSPACWLAWPGAWTS
jgi:hypothetical protein